MSGSEGISDKPHTFSIRQVMNMDLRTHWEKIYNTKAPDQVSWYRPHLDTSLALIKRATGDRTASIIDVGGGESTLVDDLLEQGFQIVTVLDMSQAAIDVNKARLGERAGRVYWIVADITDIELEPGAMTFGMIEPFFIF